MKFLYQKKSRATALIGIWLLWLTMSGCAVQMVAGYDSQTEMEVTELHRKVERFLIHLQHTVGMDEAKFANNRLFYDEALADLSVLRLRVSLIPKNDITMKQLAVIEENLVLLEKLHKLEFSYPDEIDPIRNAFTVCFTAILKFEMAKKR